MLKVKFESFFYAVLSRPKIAISTTLLNSEKTNPNEIAPSLGPGFAKGVTIGLSNANSFYENSNSLNISTNNTPSESKPLREKDLSLSYDYDESFDHFANTNNDANDSSNFDESDKEAKTEFHLHNNNLKKINFNNVNKSNQLSPFKHRSSSNPEESNQIFPETELERDIVLEQKRKRDNAFFPNLLATEFESSSADSIEKSNHHFEDVKELHHSLISTSDGELINNHSNQLRPFLDEEAIQNYNKCIDRDIKLVLEKLSEISEKGYESIVDNEVHFISRVFYYTMNNYRESEHRYFFFFTVALSVSSFD